MGRRFIPAVIILAVIAFAVAAFALSLVPGQPRYWSAAIGLIVLGGITPMIYAVNARIVPVFSRRQWAHPSWLYAAMVSGIAGAWLVFAGRARIDQTTERAGHGLALLGGLLFIASLIRLFRTEPSARTSPPVAFPEQTIADLVGIRFTRMAGIYLLIGLIVGFMLEFWTPGRGRWELVWAHTLLLGWFVQMASGICYHVLSRWTGERWRSTRRIRLHLWAVIAGLPAMVLALALDIDWLFAIAGPLMALALTLFVWNIWPLVAKMPSLSRVGMSLAAIFLVLGVSIGASAAMDPANHVRMRFSHATINLLGWAGLLICAVGYYLFPRLMGQPLRWPRLAWAQITAHAAGVVVTSTAFWWYLAVDRDARVLIEAGALLVAAGFLTFAAIIGGTFLRSGTTVVNSIQLGARRPPQPQQGH